MFQIDDFEVVVRMKNQCGGLAWAQENVIRMLDEKRPSVIHFDGKRLAGLDRVFQVDGFHLVDPNFVDWLCFVQFLGVILPGRHNSSQNYSRLRGKGGQALTVNMRMSISSSFRREGRDATRQKHTETFNFPPHA
jgi:hypothetical protein